MSLNDLGPVPANSVIPLFWSSHDAATGANETMSGLAVGDIIIYKGTSLTQRSSTSGFTLLDTDGIDVDTFTGVNAISIDLADNTDASFYAVGSFYTVVLGPVTIDGQTVYTVLATFRIVAAEAITGKPKVDVDGWLGTAAATPTVAGVPEVDVTHVAGATTDVSALATNVAAILVDTATIDTPGEIAAAVWNADATAYQGAGTFGLAIGDPAADGAGGIYKGVVTDAAGLNVAVDIIAIKAETAAILDDTDDIGIAGAGLTALATQASVNTIDDFLDTEISTLIGYGAPPTAAAIADAVLDEDMTAHQAQGTLGQAIGDPVADTNTIYKATVTDAAGATVGVDVVAVKAETASIQSDTDNIQTRVPAALVSGRMDASVGAMAANVVTAAAAAADLTTQLQAGLATAASITALNNLSAAQVNAEVVDALNVDTYAEPGQGAPAATATLAAKINYLYKAWRNRGTQTSSQYSLYGDGATTIHHKATFADDGTTADRGEIATGP